MNKLQNKLDLQQSPASDLWVEDRIDYQDMNMKGGSATITDPDLSLTAEAAQTGQGRAFAEARAVKFKKN